MTVYVVLYGMDYEGYDISEIFFDREDAVAHEDFLRVDSSYDNYRIQSYEVK